MSRLLALVLLAPALAFAQVEAKKPAAPAPPRTELKFDPEILSAGLHGPTGDEVVAVPRSRHESLIRLRTEWRQQALRAADGL